MGILDVFGGRANARKQPPQLHDVLQMDEAELSQAKTEYYDALTYHWIGLFMREGVSNGDLSDNELFWLCFNVLHTGFFIEVSTRSINTPFNAFEAGQAFLAKVVLNEINDQRAENIFQQARNLGAEVATAKAPPIADWNKEYFEISRTYLVQPSDLSRMAVRRMHEILRYGLSPFLDSAPEKAVDLGVAGERISPWISVVSEQRATAHETAVSNIEELAKIGTNIGGSDRGHEHRDRLEAGIARLLIPLGGQDLKEMTVAQRTLDEEDLLWLFTHAALLRPAWRDVLQDRIDEDGWKRVLEEHAKGVGKIVGVGYSAGHFLRRGVKQSDAVQNCRTEDIRRWLQLYGGATLALAENPSDKATRDVVNSAQQFMRWRGYDRMIGEA